MGTLIFGEPITFQGRTFDNIEVQKSKGGVPRPIVFGTVRPVVGNVIASTEPKIVKYKVKMDSGGGIFDPLIPDPEMEQEDVYRTYAIRICEGPVTAVTRIWRNGELFFVQDPNEYVTRFYPHYELPQQLEIAEILSGNNVPFRSKFEIHLGGYDQMPSAAMQSAFGVENVHGYRGTCYMVADNDQLNSTAGAIPQYTFEVCRGPETPMFY